MIYKTIKHTGNVKTKIFDSTERVQIKSINLANIHTSEIGIDLFYSDSNNNEYYIIKNLELPNGVSLFLSGDEIEFDKKYWSLYIKLNAGSSPVDIIIRK